MTRVLPPWSFAVVAGILGLMVGSFLNVVVYRVPLGLSISTPRSFCPTCDRQLEWWENIPLASWLALRGRCHTCHQPISVRYPLVELSTGLAFAAVTLFLDHSPDSIGYCLWAATLISITLIDTGPARSPLRVTAIGTGAGLVAIVMVTPFTHHWSVPIGCAVGAVAGGIALAVISVRVRTTDQIPWAGCSALPTIGGWLGGLHPLGAVVGAGAAVVVTAVIGLTGRRPRASVGGHRRFIDVVRECPLITGILVGALAGIIVGG